MASRMYYPDPAAGYSRAIRRYCFPRPWDLAIKIAIPLLLGICLVISWQVGSWQTYWRLFQAHTYTANLAGLLAVYTLLMLLFQMARTILWARYRPYAPLPENLPSLTVIIPAYNEGAMVEQALYSVAGADYPRDKLEIICIDDGSTDDTWEYIAKAARRFPDLIRTIRFPHNRGKKEGLYAGFIQGRGEVFVTVDSDSVIEREALRHLVAPLQHDPTIGAVAGNVRVYNRHDSLMGKMQWVRYVNLDFLRAAQSMYKTVTCTPGSLAAYRRAALLPHLEAWRHQTFLGTPCVHSEDRALTNLVLRHGWYTYYQRSAKVYTIVPETYRGVVNMYLRWERGNVRESFVQLGYLFSRYRPRNRLLPIIEFFLTQLELPMLILGFGFFLTSAWLYPPILLKIMAFLGVMSLCGLVYYLWLERDLEFVYGVLYTYYAFFLLHWIYPYAFMTVRDRRWLTR
ncbi:MAG: glycosyltransferase family 2 protein [Desulfobacca sp.]|uniref:glycosyltransferase family 2 protein n=1 Tax=Desulfobacca sp. TaxID=2067990 RepID=UPI00404B3206